jgi:hypothetical protein
MRGLYEIKIVEMREGGCRYRVTHSKTSKVSTFTITKKQSDNARFFKYNFDLAILKIQ